MENPEILDLDYATFSKIKNILEDANTMKSFLEVLPPDCSCDDVLNAMDVESRGYNMTPAKYLLRFLGNKGFRVSHLIEWFEAINLEKALVHLKKEEPLRIIEHPSEFVEINEGEELLITCRAESYPPPDYLWFKNNEPILLEVNPVLSIKAARLVDSSIYTCLVTKWCSQINQYEWIYSNVCRVEVFQNNLYSPPSFCEESSSSMPYSQSPRKNLSTLVKISKALPTVEENLILEQSANIENGVIPRTNHENITIIKQPYFNGKLAQGMSICLNCEAVSNFLLNYQWFRDGRPVCGENSSQLILKDLYSDPDTGETKWEYQCQVYNEHDQIFSQVVVVELDEVNDTTPYVAQEKIALMIANDTYDHLENLKKPAADVYDIGNLLSLMNFKILAFRNLTLTEMRNAIDLFCKLLKPGSYALFFYAGHGFELYGQTYLQPIDSSYKHLVEESVCVEYLLQCIQEKQPALNVLLLDSCRKLPPSMSECAKYQSGIRPGRIYRAKMKNNTIYGYSTSFLYASHESDVEVNSVFVKHLKKYITQDKSIQDILTLVKKDFARDPLTKNVQHPVIETSLSDPRKLCDPVQDSPTPPTECFVWDWCDIKKTITPKTFNLLNLKVKIIVEFHHHMEVFCNGIDIFVYLHVEPNVDMFILNDMEINITFKSTAFKLLHVNGIALKNANLEKGKRNFLFKKQLLDMQKVTSKKLNGNISLKFCSKNEIKYIEFSTDISKLAELQLSGNRMHSNNVEEHKDYSITKNSFP